MAYDADDDLFPTEDELPEPDPDSRPRWTIPNRGGLFDSGTWNTNWRLSSEWSLGVVTAPPTGWPNKWIHIVDGDGITVLSGSSGSGKGAAVLVTAIGALDSDTSTTTTTWRELVTLTDFADLSFIDSTGASQTFDGISDHWHLYAHGYHWIAVALTYGLDSIDLGLLKFAVGRPAGIPLVWLADRWETPQVIFSPRGADWTRGTCIVATNDLHMVEDYLDGEPAIAITVYHPNLDGTGEGSRVFRVRTNDGYYEFVDLYTSDPDYQHNAGASARRKGTSGTADLGDVEMLAPTTLVPTAKSVLKRFVISSAWNFRREGIVYDVPGYNYSMAMQVVLTPTLRALVYKVYPVKTATDTGSLPPDDGDIVLELRSANRVVATETLTTTGNRPHIAAIDGYLIVGWDEPAATSTPQKVCLEVFTYTGPSSMF